jgi:peptidoglycan/xylan/chitin deacetylase (PgdA/CDA1 family)
LKLRTAFVLGALLGATVPLVAEGAVDRPPQFVVVSFDNCSELERWQHLSDFLDELDASGVHARFTFFVSGTNFLPDAKRYLYRAPHQPAGVANIPFGGSSEDVRRRADYIDRLRGRGNEIASHAVGHFDGKQWSAADWRDEFRSYDALLRDAGLASPAPEITGFRAPYLGRGASLYAALRDHGLRYDASGVGDATAWPEKKDGLWRFNLASLRIAGSGRLTLSMDYNFLIAQSGPAGNPKHQALFREQMLRTYLEYFRNNYGGNRAPIHIGHHFSPIQGGVYQLALMDFIRAVCGLPEVRCVTYRELAEYLDRLDQKTLQALQRGDFPRTPDQGKDFALARPRDQL